MNDSNKFADSKLLTLGELREQIIANDELSFPRRREIASAIKTASVWFDLTLDMIPASTKFLRARFKHVHPARIRVSNRRVQNVRSLIMAGFRAQGLNTRLASYMTPMSSEWLALWKLIEGSTYHRTELSRLFRYCSKQGTKPIEVCDEVSAAYLVALEEEALIKKPRVRHQSVCRVWNQCSLLHFEKGWPDIQLSVPKYDGRLYRIDQSLVSEGIKSSLDGYLTYLAGSDPFSTNRKPFRPKSLEAVRGNFWRYFSALHYQGIDLLVHDNLTELVTEDMFKLGIKWFWDRNENKTSKNIGEIAWTIRCFAVKHSHADEKTVNFYAAALKRLRVHHPGLSEKNHTAMAQFDSTEMIKNFASLPLRLWGKAETMGKTATTRRLTKKSQLLIQAAVAIEILTFAPMRLANLQRLRIDEHISWQDGCLRLNIPREQVKNDQALDFPIPSCASKRIRKYIKDCRPSLAEPGNPYLFPGKMGNPKDSSCLRDQIHNTLWNEAGIRLTPHQFRHAAAKILLDDKPGYYEVVRKVLGHKSLTTTYSHYAGAETKAAIGLYDEVIINHRQRSAFTDIGKKQSAEPPFMDPLQFFGGKR
ncbi:MAG: tyrosine-type recombinase/integrase [Gammaproteobacteria bacterium]|nr:tyrosine-type recombinase/integrase [Gammaproteobacteria bacterium]